MHYDSGQTQFVIRKYNEFVNSLHTAAERQKAARKIWKFQSSRDDPAYIRKLVASHYQQVIGLLNLGGRISVYDDGLVELMFQYDGAMEVNPSRVFITYACLLHRENRAKVPATTDTGKPHWPGPVTGDIRVSMLRLRHAPGSARPAPERDLGARIRD